MRMSFFAETISAYPPQTGIDTFHPKLAQAVAWAEVTDVAAEADRSVRDRQKTGSRLKSGSKLPEQRAGIELVNWTIDRPGAETCGISWETRPPLKYPDGQIRKGALSAIFLGYELGVDGTPQNTRILAEVPMASEFGRTSLANLNSWQAKPGFVDSDACTKNRVTVFKFVITG